MRAQHFKLKRHNLNHNSQTRKGDKSKDSNHHVVTLKWQNKIVLQTLHSKQ